MGKYRSVQVSERQLEDLIRQAPDLIEDGLMYIDHQKMTDRGPLDVLMVDSGNALVVAELKITEDDTMLVQGIDYCDFVASNVDRFARLYAKFNIDPREDVRLFLVAPSFSVALLNRCKWIDIRISLFTYKCISLEGSDEIIPVFAEVAVPVIPDVVIEAYSLEDRLNYITDDRVREAVRRLIEEIKSWDRANILVEPKKYDIRVKVSGRVVSVVTPRRKRFTVYTYDSEGKWSSFPIEQQEDLETVRELLKANVERFGKGN